MRTYPPPEICSRKFIVFHAISWNLPKPQLDIRGGSKSLGYLERRISKAEEATANRRTKKR
jgi:hypothetical protein